MLDRSTARGVTRPVDSVDYSNTRCLSLLVRVQYGVSYAVPLNLEGAPPHPSLITITSTPPAPKPCGWPACKCKMQNATLQPLVTGHKNRGEGAKGPARNRTSWMHSHSAIRSSPPAAERESCVKLRNEVLSPFSVCSFNRKADETGAGYWPLPGTAKQIWPGAPSPAASLGFLKSPPRPKIPAARGPSAAALESQHLASAVPPAPPNQQALLDWAAGGFAVVSGLGWSLSVFAGQEVVKGPETHCCSDGARRRGTHALNREHLQPNRSPLAPGRSLQTSRQLHIDWQQAARKRGEGLIRWQL